MQRENDWETWRDYYDGWRENDKETQKDKYSFVYWETVKKLEKINILYVYRRNDRETQRDK